jgi:hypothetical protein
LALEDGDSREYKRVLPCEYGRNNFLGRKNSPKATISKVDHVDSGLIVEEI